MKTRLSLLALLLVLVLGACAEDRYPDNDFVLITRYHALAACSCLFVSEMDEDFCGRFAVQDPPVATHTIDWEARAVDAQGLLLWGARAHHVSEHNGCVLDD